MGLIEKIPGGRKANAPRAQTDDKVIERARAVVASAGAELLVPVTPWDDQTHAEKLGTLTGKALDKTKDILELVCDPSNLKLLSIRKDAALSIIAAQVKVDETQLRAQNDESRDRALAEVRRRIEQYQANGRAKITSDPKS